MLTLPCRVNNCSGSSAVFPDLFRKPPGPCPPPSPLIWTLPEVFSNAFYKERSQAENLGNLPTHFHVVRCQIKQRGKFLCLIISNLDLVELQIVSMTHYIAA